MLRVNKIASFDRVIDIRSSAGAVLYEDVPAAELKARGNKTAEGFQTVGVEKRGFLIRKINRNINQTMAVFANDTNKSYSITSVHFFGGDRAHLVIEVERRDND